MPELVNDDLTSIESRLDSLYNSDLSTSGLSKLFYVRGIIERVSKKQHQPSANLITKAYKALNELELSLERQLHIAQEQLNIIEEDYAHAFGQAKALCESKSYSALTNLFKALQQKSSSHYFKELISDMGGVGLSSAAKPEQASPDVTNKIKQTDLQSFKQYQSMFEQMALDRLLARVMKEIPENAGPLNPERLVIRSFKALQEISPDYLSGLISYYESLLTLQLLNSSDK